MSKSNTKPGFTIVELLIVIVVIGILAAITIVAFSGVQAKARDSTRTSEINRLKKALEMYYIDEGKYPAVCSDNSGCNLPGLAAFLVPKYIASIPSDPKSGIVYQYVRGAEASNAYAIRMLYESRPPCHTGMNNTGINWWGYPACV